MSERTIDPRPAEMFERKGDHYLTAEAWNQRGEIFAAKALQDWPWIDWESAHRAATCFALAKHHGVGPA